MANEILGYPVYFQDMSEWYIIDDSATSIKLQEIIIEVEDWDCWVSHVNEESQKLDDDTR